VTSQRAAVFFAVVAAAVLAVLGSAIRYGWSMLGGSTMIVNVLAPGGIRWPIRRGADPLDAIGFMIGLVALLAPVAVAAWLGARGVAAGRGFWPVLLSSWLGAVVGGLLGGLVSMITVIISFPEPNFWMSSVLGVLASGSYSGMTSGWLVGLAAAIGWRVIDRRRPATIYGPGSSPLRSTPPQPPGPGSARPQ
jgi:hypothetical protein